MKKDMSHLFLPHFCRMDAGSWTPDSKKQYNLQDAVFRSTTQVRIFYNHSLYLNYLIAFVVILFPIWTCLICFIVFLRLCILAYGTYIFGTVSTQVYPKSWTAIYVALDNVGMWNLRSEFWARQYLGQQFYLRVYTPVKSTRDEYLIPANALLCGRAAGRS